jgi:tetratricopeptide (TPR) repeat protein
LSESASRLREKLGESLSSIKRYDVKIDQATTSSLEALKAYANGNEQRAMGNPAGALPFYLRAIELDQNFAMAHARLAVHYGNNSEFEKAQAAAQRAYELRDRVSDHERFYISEKYHNYVTGDLDKAIEVLQAWAKTYPNDFIPRNNLSNNYGHLGLYEQSLKEALEAVRLDPRSTTARGNVINSFMKLGRWDEARQAIDELRALAPESDAVHFTTYILGFLRNDQASMQKELELVRGKPTEAEMIFLEASVAAYGGRMKRSEELAQNALELFKRQERIENVAQVMEGLALTQALVGNCKEAQTNATSGLSMSPGRVGLSTAGLVYAICGNAGRSLSLAEEITKKYPTDTASVAVLVPLIRAETDRKRGNATEALRTLETVRRYDLGNITGLISNYLRGLAYLDQRSGIEAAAEFQKIIDRPGIDPTSVILPLAHLGIARAAALNGDHPKARKEYQDFFALWKDADKDVPVLLDARKEYEQLQ